MNNHLTPETIERAIANNARAQDKMLRCAASAIAREDWAWAEKFLDLAYWNQAELARLETIRL